MLDRGQVQNAYRGGCPPRSSEVKGQVKFQVAPMELIIASSILYIAPST